MKFLTTGLISVMALALAGGCAADRNHVPPPSFEGPRVVVPPPKPVTPQQVRPVPRPVVTQAPRIAPAVPAAWMPRTQTRPWKWIVVHHSATANGSAADFDKMHRDKGWDELGYHFVIGNGTHSGDGQVEVGTRWAKQKWGAHAKTPDNRFNDHGIGICLVGNFDTGRPTARQMRALAELTAYLMKTYRIPPQNIIGHKDTKATDCPGRFCDVNVVRQMAVRIAANPSAGNPGAELLMSDTVAAR